MTDVTIDDAIGTPVSKKFPGYGLYSGHVVSTAPGHIDRFTVRCKFALAHLLPRTAPALADLRANQCVRQLICAPV